MMIKALDASQGLCYIWGKEIRMQGFSVIYRNPGHWDIARGGEGRLFRIRGEIGWVLVYDERNANERRDSVKFSTVNAAMTYIADALMFEHLGIKGESMLDSDGNKLIAVEKKND